ncbi:5-oxoprolinase subunit PxpB [Echinicola jeungdonensis]|uniref:5-oxoprolinase subunit PxpB n=1 Tax=Echinicola jeungdonensis TaxID=709343 RepID=A0ABV5J5G2_9BACT|nr:5-oxoprolinase subunit PxpB [Echinicola jeungdonensis]MDN3670564.1 5-oxoprolinase subunit PxpB [Echinicola jeungdonensis]
MPYSLNYKFIAPKIIEISWPDIVKKEILLEIMRMKKRVLTAWKDELLDIIMGYHRLSLHFNHEVDLNHIIPEFEEFYQEGPTSKPSRRKCWKIPVCYQGKDLDRVSQKTGLDQEEIISLHQSNSYLLHFYGFMPGFMYLGGLNEKLFAPRKEVPDPLIEKGSVAIGGKQTGIYPMDSPGGWNIIGKTPILLFDIKSPQPVFAQPGDEISFYSIGKEEFMDLQQKIKHQHIQPKHEPAHASY